MPQITKDPLGNDVELLNLTEWSDKNQKDLNEDTLNQYAGYATGQFLRAGQKPEDFQDKLYSGLFQKGQQAGVFQPQDEAQTTQLFESFANKPLTDDAADLDLVSKSLLNTDPEQAARVADVYQRVKSGQPDPNLELDLEDVKKNIATPDRIQEARISYAKERGLGFIDYPTDEPGRRDVWVNNQANPDRKAIYDTLDLAQGVVDPRSAALAEEWIKTDEGRTTNRWGQRTNSEIQSLLQERLTQADPESAFQQNMASAVEYASESAKEYGIGADVTAKAPTDEVAGTKQVIATPTGAVYAEGTAQRVASNRVADTAIRSAYRNLKETDPNNALVSEYSEDQFLNAARDFVRQRITTPTNQDDPTKNFVTLTDGTRAPLASAALLPKEKFAQAMDTLGLDEKEKAAAASLRTSWISANLTPIRDALFDFEGDKFLEFTQKNVDKYSGTVELTEAYLNQMEPSTWQTFGAKAQGVLRSVPNSLSAIFQAVGGGASNAINWEGGQKAFADWAEADAMQEQRRGTFVNLYGGEMGLGYTLFSQAAPLLADIAISKGAGTLAKVAAKPVVGSAIRTTEGLMGQTAKTFIGNALKPETKSLVGNYLKKFTVAGAEKSPAQVLRAVRRDLEEKFVAGTATATQIGTSFTRSAQQAWTNTSMEMRQAKNPDGTPKYTEEEINDTATTNALYSGAITALVERGFGKVFGEGADVTAIGTANIRQLKSYSNRLTGALERGGFGGSELFDTLKQVSREVVNEGWGDAIKQIPAEAAEEFTDEFTQNVVQNLLDDEQINFKQAFTQGLQAAVVGGVYGGALGTTNKIGLRQADIARDTFAGTAQSIERDLMDRTVAKLQESGGNPQTIAALQDRMRVAQRRGQAISQNIPVRAAKQDLINELDATSEEPFEVPTAPAEPPSTKAPASVTKFASQLAKELAVNEEELNSIQPSGTDKQGNPQVTPNDVRAFVNRRTEQMGLDLNSFLPGPDVTAPEGGFQLVGEERTDNPENRTFNDLSNRVVVIDGLRGRLRIEDEGVILDPEDGSTPFEVTPNKDLPVKDFEGFNTLLQEGAAVSPRRQAREVSEVTDGGQIVYGDTTYDLPEKPLIANIKRDDTGAVESMHMRVYNSKGLATWVYVAGDNVPKVETAYRVRGPEAITGLTAAVDNATRKEVNRNAAAQTFKAKQSKQRRKDKRAKNNAPLVTDRGQRAAEAAPDYRATRINQPGAPQQLVEEIRAVATQLGIDPEVYTDDAELFALVAPELAAGLDLQAFTPQQKSQAVQNLARNGNNPETLLEYLISDELLPPQERVKRDSNIASLRARNSNQLKKHGIKPGASVKTILENVARTASSKAHRESAKELLRLGADSVPTSFAYLPNNIGVAGAYLPASNAVVVNLASDNGGGALDAMLHELGHAVTDRVVTAPANEFEQQVRSRLMSLRAEYAERANAKYGDNMPPDLRYALEGRASLSEPFSDVDGARELVAHFYGSSKFRKQLVELSPEGGRNFVQKFIDLIASLFSGQPVASKQYQDLAKVITDLSNANQTLGQNPYGRTVAQVAASRAGVNHESRVGPLFGVPNPHSRDDLEWILHQVQTLRYSDLSNEEINDIILTQRFGMFTGENPNDTQFSERENKEFNKKAVQWLQERGYQVIPIVGKYNRGENSFLVPGLTDQDAVDAANDLVQDSVVTNTGMYFKGGLYHPRVGEAIDQPIGADDNFFSTLLDTNGNVTTIRVGYDFDTSLDSGIKYSKGDQQAAPVTQIARSLAAQGEFQVVEDREINKHLQFENGRLLVNPALADARYEGYDVEDTLDLQELDTRLAVAIGLANDTNGPSIQLSFEEVGLSPDSVIEQAAYNTLTNADLQDLLKVKDQAKQFVASAYYHIALRNNGDNERLATAQNRVADLYRYLLRDGAGLPDGPEKFNPLDVGPVTLQLANRSKTPAPIVRYSRAAVDIDPVEVRSRTKAGKAVGTRNPTSAKATEDGADPSNLVDLASLKRNPQAYRKNALLLLEYPIVAREFPELAKEYAKIRGAVLKAQDKAKANGIKIKGAKDTAKKTLASYLGVTKAKVSGKMLEDAIENPEAAFVTKEQPGTVAGNKEARTRSKALAAFNKNLDQIKKYEAEGAVLGTDSSKALKTYTDTLDKIAKDPKHPIAKQADEIYDTLIEVTKSNLRMLMDVFPSDIRDIANLWYDGANIIAQQFAGDNYSIEQSAGVLAVFSPQKDWFMNVELAKRTMEIWTVDQEYEWDDAMSARWLLRGGEPELKENKDGTLGYAKGIKPDLDENGEHRTDENGMLLFHGWGSEKVKAKRQQAFERLQSLKGKKLKDLSPEQQAWFVRMRAETKYPTGYPIVSPDGRFGNPSTSTNNKGVTKEIKLAWGTYGSIGKAINILTAPAETQMKVISDELGDQHKVRSFYNNIVDPQNNDGHVTMDTHAIAALFWQAFSGNSREVGQNFGTANTATDSLTGVGGLYPAFAEAYRAVAAEYGMLPRQVQSITWEAVRMLFTARWKSKSENVNGVRAKWVQYQNNEISLDQAQTAVFAMATNGKDLATAVANSNDEQLGLGFPSWADVVEGPAPAGAGIALSRAATQLDTDYLAAVNAGDVAAQQKLVDAAARAAGGIEVYHGGDLEGSTIDFKKAKRGAVSVRRENAFYGSTNKKVAESYRGATNRMFFFLQNPFEISTPTNRPASWTGKTAEITNGKRVERKTSLSIGEAIDRAKQNNKDGVVYSNIVDTGPAWAAGDPIGDTVVIFNSNQAKSADPIVRDDNGNVIPLSQRFDLAKPDIRYSRAATQLDADYMKAVESKDVGEQQRLVGEAASKAGYNIRGYHGTRAQEGFTEFMPNEALGGAIFVATDPAEASAFGRIMDVFIKADNVRNGVVRSYDEVRAIAAAKKRGQDAIRVTDGLNAPVNYAVFDPNQIKSADPITRDANGNVIPLSQRFDLAKPDIRYSRAAGADTAPKAFRGRMVQLTHWSKATELKQTDPTEHGNGGAGKELERRREYGDIYVPRTYFGYGKYHRETFIGGNRYSMVVDGDSLYDLDRDPLDLYPDQEALQKAGYARFDNRAALTLFEKAIKDAGYKGYVSTSYQAGILFNKQKVTKVKDGNTSLPLAAPGDPEIKTKKPRYSKALLAITSPDPESAFTVSLDDLYVNKATGEWDAGGPVSRLFRASGNMDPRLFEAAKYQERGLRLAKVRLKDLMQSFQAALKSEPNADLDDVNLALGSTEPTVTTAQRDAAESVRSARIDKANEAFDKAPANKAYLDAVNTARVNYATHRSKQKYTAEIQQAREDRKNSPEIQLRNAAIAAADAQYSKDIQAARMSNLAPVRKAQQQAQLRLEQNSPETAAAIANFRVAIDNLSSQLIDELDPGDPLRAIVDQNLGVYLTRTYRIHQDEGYAQRVLEDSEFASQRTRARAFFEKQWIDNTYDQWRSDVAYEPYSDSEVMALVRAEAKSKDVGTRELYKFVDKHSSTPKTFGRITNRTDLTRFMQKGEVPPELRMLLGEVQNPIENALRTYGNLAQFLGTQRLLTQYTKIGLDNDWLVPAADVENDPVKYRGYAPLVNTTDTNGGDPLAQYYAQPEVVTAFQTMFAPAPSAERNDAKKIWDIVQTGAGRLIGASMGFLTLGSTGFYIRNLVSIPIFSAANGFVPTPSNIATAFKGIKQVYGKNLEGLGADMIMLGVSEGSMVSQTMRDFVRGAIDDPDLISNQIEAMLKEVGTPGNFLVKAWKGTKITVDSLATLNDQIDMLYKGAYWAHEIDVQTKANKYRTVPLTPQQIKQEAARIVRLTTQGRERVAPIAKEFQQSGLGMLFNSFFRFMAEMYRLPLATIQLGMEEVKSGNPVLATRGRQRLIGLGSTLAILGYGAPALLKYMFDVEDDEEEAVRIAQPSWATDSNLFITSNPEDESITTWDITYINGFSPVTDGIARSIHHAVNGRWEKIPGVMASNLAKNFLSPQIAVEAFTQASNNRDDRGAALWLEDDSTTTKISKVLKHLANNAYKLRTPTQFWKAYQAYTNGGVSDPDARYEKAYELVVGEIMPIRVNTRKTEQLSLTAFGKLKRQLDAAKQTLGEFKSYEQLDKERVDGVYDRYETSLVAINERIRKTAKGFEKLGMSYAEMERQAYEAGISKRRFKDAVRNGRVERYMPSNDAMKDYMRIGGPENGAERVRFLKEAAYARPQYLKLNQD